jgi:hypothetical protein
MRRSLTAVGYFPRVWDKTRKVVSMAFTEFPERIQLGLTKKIGLHLAPVFKLRPPDRRTVKPLATSDGNAMLTPSNNTLKLSIEMESTSIASNIQKAELTWIFRDENKKEIVSFSRGGITLAKSGSSFIANNLSVPLVDAVTDHPNELIGKKGTIGLSVGIEDVDQFEIVQDPPICWDFSCDLSIAGKGKIFDLADFALTMAQNVSIQCTKGASFPASYKVYLAIWENDAIGDIGPQYSCRMVNGSSVNFKFGTGPGSEVQGTLLTFGSTGAQTWYVGCDPNRKLNYGNSEYGTADMFEFNCMLLVCTDISLFIPASFIKIKDIPATAYKKYKADIFNSARPRVEIVKKMDKDKVNDKSRFTLSLVIKNISTQLSTQDINFVITRLNSSDKSLYTTESYDTAKAGYEIPKEAVGYTYKIVSRDTMKGLDYYDQKEITFRIIVEFNTTNTTLLDAYRIVFPFVDLVSDPDLNDICTMFNGVQAIGTSVKQSGSTYVPDTLYRYIAITVK